MNAALWRHPYEPQCRRCRGIMSEPTPSGLCDPCHRHIHLAQVQYARLHRLIARNLEARAVRRERSVLA